VRPATLALLEERDDEVVLGREVVVEGRLGDACVGDDLVDPHAADPPGREQLVSGFEKALTRARS
jgi:hypothetical protein